MAEQPPIERAFFREAEDGASVFFPWGLTHRGYRLRDADARRRALRAASLLMGSATGIASWAAYHLQSALKGGDYGPATILGALAWPGAALAAVFLAYALWVSRFVEGQAESDLQVSREERLREAAALASPRKVATIGLVLCALSGLVIWLEPRLAWVGLLGIGLGLGLAWWSRLLARAAADAPARSAPVGRP